MSDDLDGDGTGRARATDAAAISNARGPLTSSGISITNNSFVPSASAEELLGATIEPSMGAATGVNLANMADTRESSHGGLSSLAMAAPNLNLGNYVGEYETGGPDVNTGQYPSVFLGSGPTQSDRSHYHDVAAYYGQPVSMVPSGPQQASLEGDGQEEDDRPRSVGDDALTASGTGSESGGYIMTGVDGRGPLKLFVGQVPKAMMEEDLFPTFANFGPIKELMIIRDKHTGQHRGCAFITYVSADDAFSVQETLHDQLTLPGGRKPLQIRPATESGRDNSVSSAEQENKLFVGMTSRNADEMSIRELFAPFGEIKEIYIIRHADGSNKGCAFLKFLQRESALSAIEALNDKVVMEGAARPLIVKFADSKAQRRARHTSRGGRSHGDSPGGNPYYMHHSGPPVPVYPSYGQMQQGPHIAMPPQYSQHFAHGPYSAVTPSGASPHNYMFPVPRHPHAGHPYGFQPAGPFPMPIGTNTGPPSEGSDQYETSSIGGRGGGGGSISGQSHSSRQGGISNEGGGFGGGVGGVNPRPREGPVGANLFIYHLPHDLTDADLATAFNPFGSVISAKVYVDKYTGESKGFGFVSYDSVVAAEAAIDQMNGFQIGSKRLKVQHKRLSSRRATQYEFGLGMPVGASSAQQARAAYPDTMTMIPSGHHPDAGLMGMMHHQLHQQQPQQMGSAVSVPHQFLTQEQLDDSEEYNGGGN